MWVKILKVAVKAAIATGLHKKALEWLKGKAQKAVVTEIGKLETKLETLYASAQDVDLVEEKIEDQ